MRKRENKFNVQWLDHLNCRNAKWGKLLGWDRNRNTWNCSSMEFWIRKKKYSLGFCGGKRVPMMLNYFPSCTCASIFTVSSVWVPQINLFPHTQIFPSFSPVLFKGWQLWKPLRSLHLYHYNCNSTVHCLSHDQCLYTQSNTPLFNSVYIITGPW